MRHKGFTFSIYVVAAALAVAAVGLSLGAKTEGRDWPQFRGLNRDGVSEETGLLTAWPEGGPKEIWRRPLGEGYSAISVVDGRLYTMYGGDHEDKPTEFAAAFDAASGEELWRVPLGEKYDTQFGNGPRSTPTVDGDTLFTMDSHGTLVALATKDGSERWRLNLTEAFGSQRPHWGFSTSPVVEGGQVIVEGGGGEGKSYAGLDRKTGEVKWTTGDGGPGYNSALPVEIQGKRRYVYVAGNKLMCIDENGSEVWSHDWPEGETHAMPVFLPPNRIFASGVEGVGGHLLEIEEAGGKTSVTELWNTRFMRNHFSSSIAHDGHIYGFDNATLKCISATDAKMAWAKRGVGKGALILADGHLFVLSDAGKLLLLEATPEGYTEKGSVQALEGRCWTAPVISGGRLYLRNHEEMVAYDVSG